MKPTPTNKPVRQVFLSLTAGGICTGSVIAPLPPGATGKELVAYVEQAVNEYDALNAIAEAIAEDGLCGAKTSQALSALATLRNERTTE